MVEKILFSAGTSNQLEKEFFERSKYKNLINFEGMLDTWYENTFYGRINDNFEPVALVPGADSLILGNFPGYADDVQVLGFVAEAFRNFRRDYLARVQSTNIEVPVFLDALTPVSGYVNFENYYSEYLNFLASNYISSLSSNAKIFDFPSFVEQFMFNAKDDFKNYPITKSGFLMSKHNDIKTTGLVIELSSLDTSIDVTKGELIQDPNFSCYVDYATAAGFYIDKNAPWRLMINTDSEIVRLLMRSEKLVETETPQGLTPTLPNGPHSEKTAEEVLNSIYRVKTHNDDVYHLQDFMYSLYNQIKNSLDFVYNIGYSNQELVRRAPSSSLSEDKWLEILFKVRLYELESYDEAFYREELNKIVSISRIYGFNQALSKTGTLCASIIRQISEKQKEFIQRTREGVSTSTRQTERVNANVNIGQNNTNTRRRAPVPRSVY
tara:strand:- start:3673 stop:4986 length:1314 start_codon:yes stop_codon:yes gene_type:complete